MPDIIAGIIIWFIVERATAAILEWRAHRPRRGVFPGTYRDACGPACRMKGMSAMGWRVRTERAILRAVGRLQRAAASSPTETLRRDGRGA